MSALELQWENIKRTASNISDIWNAGKGEDAHRFRIITKTSNGRITMLTPKKPTLVDQTINNAGIKYTDQGKIESVSIQGTQIFVVVRLVGKNLPDMMGNTVSCGRHLVGLPTHAPEHTATMAEVLIPLNMNSSTQVVDPKTLIGSRVQVFFKSSGFPEGCTLLSNPDARSVSREELFNLRFESKDGINRPVYRKEKFN